MSSGRPADRIPRIRVITGACFLAIKLVSYAVRGCGDPFHHDLEDIVALVDGRSTLVGEIALEPEALRSFVAMAVQDLFASGLENHIGYHLPSDAASQARLPLIVARLRELGLWRE